jgi:hypothetical protein
MARPTFSLPISSGIQGWDAAVTDNFEVFTLAPWPVYQKTAGNESDLSTVFPPGSYDRCVLFVNHSTLGWTPYFSNGTTWEIIAVQGTSVAALVDNTGGTANDTLQALPDPADAPATADALRDDLVANLIPALRNDLADLAAKVNALRSALQAGGALP